LAQILYKLLRMKKISFLLRIVLMFILISIVVGGIKLYHAYTQIYQPNVILKANLSPYIYIPTGSTLQDVTRILYKSNVIINRNSFEWLAEKKQYQNNIKPGRYKIKNNMNNNELINMLRSGDQTPVKLSFNNIRTLEQFAGAISKKIEADSLSLMRVFQDEITLTEYGFNKHNLPALFIPNTYEIYWNTTASDFFKRMKKEFDAFWNEDRRKKAAAAGLNPIEVSIIASIVFEESAKSKEYKTIAGVYINRIKKGMRLQADPTVKFALRNFEKKRILLKDLEYDSPYNTYVYSGLPPGPICFPGIKAIEAVINYEKHSYIYFCAKDDLSGYHNFAKTLQQHNENARRYQAALNKRNIRK